MKTIFEIFDSKQSNNDNERQREAHAVAGSIRGHGWFCPLSVYQPSSGKELSSPPIFWGMVETSNKEMPLKKFWKTGRWTVFAGFSLSTK